jgi:hypothetical protein
VKPGSVAAVGLAATAQMLLRNHCDALIESSTTLARFAPEDALPTRWYRGLHRLRCRLFERLVRSAGIAKLWTPGPCAVVGEHVVVAKAVRGR